MILIKILGDQQWNLWQDNVCGDQLGLRDVRVLLTSQSSSPVYSHLQSGITIPYLFVDVNILDRKFFGGIKKYILAQWLMEWEERVDLRMHQFS